MSERSESNGGGGNCTRVFDSASIFPRCGYDIDKSQGGLGVGLALVRTLLEMHRATVVVRSEGPGRGSEFSIWLPLAPERPAQADAESQDSVTPSSPLRRVLVVDDNRDAARSLATLLRIMGHDVRTAHNGQSALEAARASMPEIAILDIGLPGMDGHELARRMRDEPGGAAVLIIALTGWGQDVDRRRSAEAGFDHHLTKPADAEALRKLLSQAH
jgi:CheY-like chemotaxis protein